jgi:4-amino-4-deoxy-L-arabinose transferase-like glycosyltransferase
VSASLWWRIWSIALIIKLCLASWLPLSPDEAYYWVWSKHIQWSYFDHPPLVAWLFAVGDKLPEGMVRWPGVLLCHLGLWFWWQFLKDLLAPREQLLWLVLVLFMPLTGPGSLIVTPDLPLMFSWGFMLWSFSQLLKSGGHPRWAVTFGFAFGLGILSKYMTALFVPIAIVWWWQSSTRPPLRRWLLPTLLVAAVVAFPVWWWNLQNDWASFRFQTAHGLGRKIWKPSWTWEYILCQVAVIFPTLIWAAMRAKVASPWRWVAWFPLAFFLCTSFRGYVEINWPLVAMPSVLALAVVGARGRSWLVSVPLTIWSLALVFVLILVALPHRPEWVEETKLRDLRVFDELAQAARDFDPLFAPSYQIAAKLSFELRRSIPKLRGLNRFDFYDTIEDSRPQTNKFYLLIENNERPPPPWDAWRREWVRAVGNKYQIMEIIRP